MFIDHVVVIEAGLSAARSRLLGPAHRDWLRDACGEAYVTGMTGTRRLSPAGAAGEHAGGLARVVLLAPVESDDTVTLPVRWEALGVMGHLYPVFEASLTLTSLGETRTALRLSGAFRLPLGDPWEPNDATLLHRAATATVRLLASALSTRLCGTCPVAAVA